MIHASMDRFTPFFFGSRHNMEDLLAPHEAAAILRVPVSFVYERTLHDAIPLRRVGKYLRIPKDELLAWVDAQNATMTGRGNTDVSSRLTSSGTASLPSVTTSTVDR